MHLFKVSHRHKKAVDHVGTIRMTRREGSTWIVAGKTIVIIQYKLNTGMQHFSCDILCILSRNVCDSLIVSTDMWFCHLIYLKLVGWSNDTSHWWTFYKKNYNSWYTQCALRNKHAWNYYFFFLDFNISILYLSLATQKQNFFRNVALSFRVLTWDSIELK